MNKHFIIIFTSIAMLIVTPLAILAYNFYIREMAEKTELIPIEATPVSSFSMAPPIRGINIENTTSFLENNDFVCAEKPDIYNEGFYRTSCQQKTAEYIMTVHLFSSDNKEISLIETQFNQLTSPSDGQTVNFLGFLTHLPIEGIDPKQINDWINQSLTTSGKNPGMTAALTSNGLEYRLYGSPQKRFLEIIEIK